MDVREPPVDVAPTAPVAIAPGIDIGKHRAQTHVRFACTTDTAQLAEALARLRAWHRRAV